MLYLPTSDAIKFKAKGWIDVFGSRVAKGVGSFVTLSSRGDRRRLATYGGLASFLIRRVRECLASARVTTPSDSTSLIGLTGGVTVSRHDDNCTSSTSSLSDE